MGFLAPLFIAYVIEARAKLRFARQLRLNRGSNAAYIELGSAISCILAFLNILLLANILSVTMVLTVYGPS